jgi:hypothetical protein
MKRREKLTDDTRRTTDHGAFMVGPLYRLLISSRSVYKHGRHPQGILVSDWLNSKNYSPL